ncbi:MAG: aminopeptidase, partial [Opitutaceae bacterium]|nr:aminopeptidase [Opitutaceae bacterium]
MPAAFPERLRVFAEILVRVGLNLRPGQRLLIAEPYELYGVDPAAAGLVAAVRAAAGVETTVQWHGRDQLRTLAAARDYRRLSAHLALCTREMQAFLHRGDALLFLQGSQAGLFAGLSEEIPAEVHRIGWEHFGPIAQQLMQGATNWTVAPAPAPAWAEVAYPDLPPERRMDALWEDVFDAFQLRSASSAGVPPSDPFSA